MNASLASFRELKGIGPATEARLHEAGIYTWEALAAAATALAAAVRGNGDTLRDIASHVAERQDEAGGQEAPRPPGAEHLEAFVLRLALAGDGEPLRSTLTHVRTSAEEVWAGWTPSEVTAFVAERAGIREPEPQPEPAPPPPAEAAEPRRRAAPATRSHTVVLDAGKAIGGTTRDVDLVLTGTPTAGPGRYHATLSARQLGAGGGWTTVATSTGAVSPPGDVPLSFPGVGLPLGIHRLRLTLKVTLDAPARRPPALALAEAEPAAQAG
jgi:hypothetical protein